MPQGTFGDELRTLRAEQKGPRLLGFQRPTGSEEPMDPKQQAELWGGASPLDSFINSIPEVAGIASMAVPQGRLPALLTNLIRLSFPAAGEAIRQVMTGEDPSLEKVAVRTAANAAPTLLGMGGRAATEGAGRMLSRQALARGVQSAQGNTDALVANLAQGGTGIPAGADVSRMMAAAAREGARLTTADAQKFARWARELEFIQSRRLTPAYLRRQPETAAAAALRRAGGDMDTAIPEFRGLASTLAKTREGAARQGFNWPRFLAGAGVGGTIDYMTGMSGVGTTIGTGIGALEASIPLKFNVGRRMLQAGSSPYAQSGIEGAARAGMTAGTAMTAQPPKRRQLR